MKLQPADKHKTSAKRFSDRYMRKYRQAQRSS